MLKMPICGYEMISIIMEERNFLYAHRNGQKQMKTHTVCFHFNSLFNFSKAFMKNSVKVLILLFGSSRGYSVSPLFSTSVVFFVRIVSIMLDTVYNFVYNTLLFAIHSQYKCNKISHL